MSGRELRALGTLGEALGCRVPDAASDFCRRFDEAIQGFCEVGVQLPSPAVTVITRCTPPGFPAALHSYLRGVGYDGSDAARTVELVQRFGLQAAVRVLDRGRGAPEVGVYVRRDIAWRISRSTKLTGSMRPRA